MINLKVEQLKFSNGEIIDLTSFDLFDNLHLKILRQKLILILQPLRKIEY